MAISEQALEALKKFREERHDEYLAGCRRRYHERMKKTKYRKHRRDLANKHYASMSEEEYNKCKERSLKYYYENKDKPEYKKRKAEWTKEYFHKHPRAYKIHLMKMNIKRNKPYTTSNGILIEFVLSGYKCKFSATKGKFKFVSREYSDIKEAKRMAKKRFE